MSIIDKLGIAGDTWGVPHFARNDIRCDCGCLFSNEHSSMKTIADIKYHDEADKYDQYYDIKTAKANARLIAAAPEMLEALIESIIFIEDVSEGLDIANLKHYQNKINAVEKATGLSWEEVKELL